MKNSAKMEAYLDQLDQALSNIPVSQRAEIVLEVRKKILEELENKPNINIDSFLATLGKPRDLAAKYLLERGLRPAPAPRSILKRLITFSILAFVSMIALSLISFWFFSPVIDFDEESGNISFFGGLIDMDDIDGTFQVGSTVISNGMSTSEHKGNRDVGEKERMHISFSNGKMELETSQDNTLHWQCKTTNLRTPNFLEENDKEVFFQLANSSAASCKIQIPPHLNVTLDGPNGSIILKKPAFSIQAEITNGSVEIEPDSEKFYRYNLSIVNGVMDDFESSPKEMAIPIKISIVNGKIKQLDRD